MENGYESWRTAALVSRGPWYVRPASRNGLCRDDRGAAGTGGSGGSGSPGSSGGNTGPSGSGSSGAGSGGSTGSGGTGGGPSSATGSGGTPGVPIATTGTAPAESAGTLVMRRLTYREYDHNLAYLLGDTTAPAEGGNAWSPDAPNAVGYVAPNSAADLQVDLYNQTADTLVENALQNVAAGKAAGKFSIPCKAPTTTAAETTCATQFITAFGLEAFRRPVAAAEQMDLLTLFSKVRGLGLSFNESIGAVAKGMLQSPNFLYHWEIGPTAPIVGADGLVPLTGWQLASRSGLDDLGIDAGRYLVAGRPGRSADDTGRGRHPGHADVGGSSLS